MQNVNCYNCESDSNIYYASENGFILVKCSKCGLLFVNPRPDDREIAAAHKQGVHIGSNKLKVTGFFNHNKISRYLDVLRNLFGDQSALNEKTWLDIGCGHGEFLVALQKFSKGRIKTKGTEPNVHKQKSAQKRGLDVSYLDLDMHTGKYDVISLLNVYSHLPNPPAAILSWKRLLKLGGALLLETGDTANFDNKDHFRPFLLPDHLSFASESIVVAILEKSGFELLGIKKYPFRQLDLISIAKDVIKVFLPNYKSQLSSFMKPKMYSSVDMFIRAKLKTS